MTEKKPGEEINKNKITNFKGFDFTNFLITSNIQMPMYNKLWLQNNKEV
jgi:hypothetical protein